MRRGQGSIFFPNLTQESSDSGTLNLDPCRGLKMETFVVVCQILAIIASWTLMFYCAREKK